MSTVSRVLIPSNHFDKHLLHNMVFTWILIMIHYLNKLKMTSIKISKNEVVSVILYMTGSLRP